MNIIGLKRIQGVGVSQALDALKQGAEAQGMKVLTVSAMSSVSGVLLALERGQESVVVMDECDPDNDRYKAILEALKSLDRPGVVYVGETA